MSSAFGNLCRDLIGGSLKIKNTMVLDDNVNLRVNNTVIRGDLKVLGTTQFKGPISSSVNEFVQLETTAGSDPFWIEPVSGYDGSTLLLTKLPCSGLIESVDITTGNILYAPNVSAFAETSIDVFQYSIQDSNEVPNKVTQLICRQALSLIPPFIQNNFGSQTVSLGAVLPLTQNVSLFFIQGSLPIDFSSITVSSFLGYVADYAPPAVSLNSLELAAIPFSTADSMDIAGPGVITDVNELTWTGANANSGITFTVNLVTSPTGLDVNWSSSAPAQTPLQFVIKITLQVSDIEGNPSNNATLFFVNGG